MSIGKMFHVLVSAAAVNQEALRWPKMAYGGLSRWSTSDDRMRDVADGDVVSPLSEVQR